MEKICLSRYPKGVAAELPAFVDKTLEAVLESAFHKFGQSPCFTNMGKTLTFSDVDRLSRAFALFLRSD